MRRNRIVELLKELVDGDIKNDHSREKMMRNTKQLVEMLRVVGKVTIQHPSSLDNLPPTQSIFE